jgi:hypothetical protein
MDNSLYLLAPVPVFTDEEFIAFLTEQGFWTEGLLTDETEEG